MDQNQTAQTFKKPLFLLFFLIFVFVIKGTFLNIIFPIFQNPDEQIHYATLQYLAEPKEKTWPITVTKESILDGTDISTYHLSEETIRSAQAAHFDEVKFQKENTQEFSLSAVGINENEIVGNSWKRSIDTYPVNTSGTVSVYYFLGTEIEQFLSHQSMLTRFFSARFLSVAFGLLVVGLAYFVAHKIGFSKQNSLILAALIAFQPMFSVSAAQINIDIALILAFSFYTFISVRVLGDGISWKNLILLFLSLILVFYSKGPGVVLFVITPFLLGYLVFRQFNIPLKKFLFGSLILFSVFSVSLFLLVPKNYLIDITNASSASKFDSPLLSLTKYADKTLDMDAFLRTETSYWGHFGWLDTKVSDAVINTIWMIEVVALIGIILYLIPTRFLDKFGMTVKKDYLPEKKYVIFFLGIILALQLAIRFYDWRIFDTTGQILIGTPGRYFLPNVIPHMLLVVIGLGFFTRNKRQLDILLKTLLVLMVLLSLYAIIDVIIPRYYL